MHYLVTGAAGFIGSHLVDRLLAEGHRVTGYDNFSTGRRTFLEQAIRCPRFHLEIGDTSDTTHLTRICQGVDVVCHLAANADVSMGLRFPRKDLEQNTIATSNVLEAMRFAGVKRIVFSSTSAIYGDATCIPTPEDVSFPIQSSLYGASKVACEGLITAYAAGFGIHANIFRFAPILGERYNHGHLYHFYQKLRQNPMELEVLGDGRQAKSYLYVQDCINGILLAEQASLTGVYIYNLASADHSDIRTNIAWIAEYLHIDPVIRYSGGERGWAGDNPLLLLDSSRMRELGWVPYTSIHDAVIKTVRYFEENPWLF